MPRIIPEELNKKLRLEYQLRFFTAFFILIASVLFINILLISSSYLLLTLYEQAYVTNESSEKKGEINKIIEQNNLKIKEVYALTQKIPSSLNIINTSIPRMLTDYASEGVEINTIEITSEGKESKIVLRGNAETREVLLNFQDTIQNNISFKDFSIPIESLTKQKDISFNVTFTYAQN